MNIKAPLAVILLFLLLISIVIIITVAQTDIDNNFTGESSPRQQQSQVPKSLALAISGTDVSTSIPNSNLIVFNSLDGQIILTDPKGSERWTISPDQGFFTWPGWSPDMNHIAFSGKINRLDGTEALSLFVHNLRTNRTHAIHTNERGSGPLLPAMPHYSYWSPDSNKLAFTAKVPFGVTLHVFNSYTKNNPIKLLEADLIYQSWSPDSEQLLVHTSDAHYLVDINDETSSITSLDAKSNNYRTPAWTNHNHEMALVSKQPDKFHKLYKSDTTTTSKHILIQNIPKATAFLFSPNGEFVAVGHSNKRDNGLYKKLNFFSKTGEAVPIETDANIFAFFWSPDSSKLAYIIEAETKGFKRWMILDIGTGIRQFIVDFIPSGPQTTIFRLFDQFAYSHSPWAPDSNSLVFSGSLRTEEESVTKIRQQSPHIIVANVKNQPIISTIAPGLLAFWSSQ